MSDTHLAAVRDPYTSEPGAFTAALALGLVEMHEGQPRLTPAGLEAKRLEALRGLVAALAAAPCKDCDGTGWAAATNPGTGGGTGRDEQIAVPCPQGCPDADESEPRYDAEQRPVNLAHVALHADGTTTTVMPDGRSFRGPGLMLEPRPGGGKSTADLLGPRGCPADELGPEDPRF
jgi:hypothetical protein